MNNLNSLFPSNSSGPTTDYPYGSARNITTSGDDTGTPFIASLQNDIIGLQQFLLQEAGIVPDGSPDNATDSQQFDAMWKILNMRTVTHNFTADADYTLSDEENLRLRFEIIDLSPVLTATRAVIVNDIQKRFLVQNDTLQTITFRTSGGTGIDVEAGENADLYCDGTNVIEAIATAVADSSVAGVRQTVQSSSVDANGLPDYISIGTGLAVDIAATSIPVTIHASNKAISDDRLGSISADTSIGSLTDATTNYLYADVAADGTITLGATTLAPVYQFGGTYSIVSGQATFNISEMIMKIGNGASADQTHRVFIGEAVTAGGVVTSVVNYALNGYYDSGWTATVPSGAGLLSKNTNLGVYATRTSVVIENTTTDRGYAVGDQIILAVGEGNNNMNSLALVNTRNTSGIISLATALYVYTKTGSAGASIVAASWKYKLITERGW